MLLFLTNTNSAPTTTPGKLFENIMHNKAKILIQDKLKQVTEDVQINKRIYIKSQIQKISDDEYKNIITKEIIVKEMSALNYEIEIENIEIIKLLLTNHKLDINIPSKLSKSSLCELKQTISLEQNQQIHSQLEKVSSQIEEASSQIKEVLSQMNEIISKMETLVSQEKIQVDEIKKIQQKIQDKIL